MIFSNCKISSKRYTEFMLNKISKLVISILICEAVGLIATPFTISAIPSWYAYLNKPFFSPPNWVFGPVWTILYLMMGLSLYLIWGKDIRNSKIKIALYYFTAQLILNFTWSILFFGLRSPVLGLVDIALLWILILLTIIKFYKISRFASYLLIPYLLWVSFASILNLAVVILNQ